MNETLLQSAEETVTDAEMPQNPVEPSAAKDATRPDGVPDKFWDSENGVVRIDAMVKSYQQLERKMGAAEHEAIPESADDYEVTIDGQAIEADVDVNSRLHAAGLSQAQVQTVYELANEKLMPMLSDMTASYDADSQTQRLENHFGGAESWSEAKRQIAVWGRENYSDDVFDALSSTYEGVLTMRRMMSSNEPGLGRGDGVAAGPDEDSLKSMMADPRYWRQRDPAYVEQVRQGFRALYPD